MNFEPILSIIVSGMFLATYSIHFIIVLLRHLGLIRRREIGEKISNLEIGTSWNFLAITVVLPLFCSFYASWVMSPIEPMDNVDIVKLLPTLFFNIALSVFTVMITIEVGFLYNDPPGSWKPFILTALVLDLLALLAFVTVLEIPEKIVESSSMTLIVWYTLVSIGSLLSSCATIYFAKLHHTIGSEKTLVNRG